MKYFILCRLLPLVAILLLETMCQAEEGRNLSVKRENEKYVVQSKIIKQAIVDANGEKTIAEIARLDEMIVDNNTYVAYMADILYALYSYIDKNGDSSRLFHQTGLSCLDNILSKEDVHTHTIGIQWNVLFDISIRRLIAKAKINNGQLDKDSRLVAVERLCVLWKRFEDKIDSTFSLEDHKDALQSPMVVSPYYHTHGMDPNDIEDENERRKCVDYIAKQNSLLRKHAEQCLAKQSQKENKKNFVQMLVALSSIKPDITKEIHGILKKHAINKDLIWNVEEK